MVKEREEGEEGREEREGSFFERRLYSLTHSFYYLQ